MEGAGCRDEQFELRVDGFEAALDGDGRAVVLVERADHGAFGVVKQRDRMGTGDVAGREFGGRTGVHDQPAAIEELGTGCDRGNR